MYTCRRSLLTAVVPFSDKPGRPEGPLEITDVHKNHCKLKWKKPKDDGGLPITGYVIEKMDTSTGRWQPAARADGDTTDTEVKGLEPGKRYEFRVKAVNEEGESEPLDGDQSILAKDPYGTSAANHWRIVDVRIGIIVDVRNLPIRS